MISIASGFLRGSYTPIVTPFREGQVDLERELSRTRSLRALGNVIGPFGHGAFGNKAQEVARGTFRITIDSDEVIRRAHVRDLGFHARDDGAEHATVRRRGRDMRTIDP